MSGLNPKLVQFLRAFAQLPPSERPSALLSIGVPPNLLSTELPKFEMQAEALGFQLNNGEAEVSGEGAAGIAGPISFARVRAARAPPSRTPAAPPPFATPPPPTHATQAPYPRNHLTRRRYGRPRGTGRCNGGGWRCFGARCRWCCF